uniref:Uncharacterized protein n=1 Tax=Caenorhabditis tropicalis TaxID=1561998 RepID=A0A1I7UDP4_9PELO
MRIGKWYSDVEKMPNEFFPSSECRLAYGQAADMRMAFEGEDSEVKQPIAETENRREESPRSRSFRKEFRTLSMKGDLCVDDSSVSCEQQGAYQQGTKDE